MLAVCLSVLSRSRGHSMDPLKTNILIAGGGSVGLSLAAELGWRGAECLMVEPRLTPNPHPRANAVANRTMEYFRRWGVDDKLIGAGVPAEFSASYFWVSSLHGREIHRLVLPGHAELERIRANSVVDPTSELHWSPYLKTIVGQHEVERVLRAHVDTLPSVQTRYGWQLRSFEERDDDVLAELVSQDGQTMTVQASWLVGCDGGRSVVREQLGIGLSGRGNLARFVSIYFKAPEFMQCHGFGPANIFFPLHVKHRGFLLNWDTGTTWTYHLILDEGVDWTTVDPRQAIESLLGCQTSLEVISVQPWTAHALTADRYQSASGRVLLAGDAAHLFTPTGGLGMNTGVSDAIDLAWKLQANIEGWAGPHLLRSYDAERRPIGRRNTAEAADNFDRLYAVMQQGDALDAEDELADQLRAQLKAELETQVKLLKSSGVLLGYRYEHSPICVPDGTPEPADDPQVYVPVARPGHRAPHVWIRQENGSMCSLLDLLGPWFTLICFDGVAEDALRLQQAAQACGLPLDLLPIDMPDIKALYGDCAYALVRPDMMVAWRGQGIAQPQDLLDVVRGQVDWAAPSP